MTRYTCSILYPTMTRNTNKENIGTRDFAINNANCPSSKSEDQRESIRRRTAKANSNSCSSHPFRFSSATIRISLRLLSSTGFVKTLQDGHFSSHVTSKGHHNESMTYRSTPASRYSSWSVYKSELWFNTEELQFVSPESKAFPIITNRSQHFSIEQDIPNKPVTPTIKSVLPKALSFSTNFKPDITGIWLSKKITAYLLSSDISFSRGCSRVVLLSRAISLDGVVLPIMTWRPSIISNATSPFSAQETTHPILVRIRFMSVRVIASSSTTRVARGGSILVKAREEEGLPCVNWSKTLKCGVPISLAQVDVVRGCDTSSRLYNWCFGNGTNVGRWTGVVLREEAEAIGSIQAAVSGGSASGFRGNWDGSGSRSGMSGVGGWGDGLLTPREQT